MKRQKSKELLQKIRFYDASCKQVLSEREILARILQGCVEEFEGGCAEDIAQKYIEGDPVVGAFAVEPSAKSRGMKIHGSGTEDASSSEGTVFYDIKFEAKAPPGNGWISLIINVEAQNRFHPGYPLIMRAIYYCARMISSQYGTVFAKSQYGKIRKVYSIWICTRPTKKWMHTITTWRRYF